MLAPASCHSGCSVESCDVSAMVDLKASGFSYVQFGIALVRVEYGSFSVWHGVWLSILTLKDVFVSVSIIPMSILELFSSYKSDQFVI